VITASIHGSLLTLTSFCEPNTFVTNSGISPMRFGW
jgi:hypothetical protein